MHPTIAFRKLLTAIRRGDVCEAMEMAQFLARLASQGESLTEEIIAVMDFQSAWENRR